ncbi:uncharacterized protein LOC130613224 isoform X1 [Hydractinia symbiolongicarpus]|uniref:uncharacterized protein LOC130613224 isoform X1 n=2 Tax=Hydractinia symbiolongicarpus TaxID=13093 RepID=UPI0025502D92|nr:uncharacterized protein LOC130613224 isoform X1 [Hydractinia symbiolongicarpus]
MIYTHHTKAQSCAMNTFKRKRRKKKYEMKGKKVRPAETGEMYINMRSIFYNGVKDEKNSQKDINVKTEQKQTSHHAVYHTEIYQTFLYIQRRVYLLSAVIGDTKRPFNTCKGYLGLLLWVMNLCIHFAFDFYEAHDVFHVSWATSIGIYLVMFVMCTAFMIRHSMRWYVRLVKKLTKDVIYLPTLKKLKFIFKVTPMLLAACSVSGAAAQYGCYAYDNALTISFGNSKNHTTSNPFSTSVEVLLNILRFTSLSHIYYMMFLILLFNSIIFYTVVHSQKIFNNYIGNELKSHPPSMSFQEAVNQFSMRTKLLREASENTSVVLAVLLVATSVSFVVNAYNFLFIQRYAIYVWFAIAPLLWTVTPLIGGALVTSAYHKLKLIVIHSWVEIPEKYDEIWCRKPPTKEEISKLPQPNWRAGLENIRRRKAERERKEKEEALDKEKNQDEKNGDSLVDTENKSYHVINMELCCPSQPPVNKDNNNKYERVKSKRKSLLRFVTKQSKSSTNYSGKKEIKVTGQEQKSDDPPEQNQGNSVHDFKEGVKLSKHSEVKDKQTVKQRFGNVVRVAQTVGKFKSMPRKKFNYEKYIKFLELTLDTIGFSLGKVTITWDRVSFFIVLLLTLVGVFAENAFLK